MNPTEPEDAAFEPRPDVRLSPVVAFESAGFLFAVDLVAINSIVMPQPVSRVPGAPNYVRGVLALRKRAIPIADLRTRLGLREGRPKGRLKGRILVLEANDTVMGLMVDSVSEVKHMSLARLEEPMPIPSADAADSLLGIGRVEGERRMILVLDVPGLLACCAEGIEAALTGAEVDAAAERRAA